MVDQLNLEWVWPYPLLVRGHLNAEHSDVPLCEHPYDTMLGFPSENGVQRVGSFDPCELMTSQTPLGTIVAYFRVSIYPVQISPRGAQRIGLDPYL